MFVWQDNSCLTEYNIIRKVRYLLFGMFPMKSYKNMPVSFAMSVSLHVTITKSTNISKATWNIINDELGKNLSNDNKD
jgi:hypothetical protein